MSKLTLSMAQCGTALALLIGCSGNEDSAGIGASGATSTAGTAPSSSGGSGAGGTASTTGGAGVAASGSPSTGGATPGAGAGGSAPSGSGGVSGSTSSAGSGGSSGSSGTGGAGPLGGAGAGGCFEKGCAGDGGGEGGATGSAGSGSAGSAGSGGFTLPTGENSVAYIGCSMAYNIGTGYKRVGGKVMWNADNYQTSAMVVQNWTNENSSSWQLFDRKMESIGGKDTVKAIMVQICIFSSRATDAELKSMIASARKHVNPGTHIFIVGQPVYQAGHECTLAGNGGAKWTDDQAKALAADSSVNQDMTYLGQFLLDSSKGEVSNDSCHASSPTGENVLGEQAKQYFGG